MASGGGDEACWNQCRPEEYDALLAASVASVREQFAGFLPKDRELDVFASPPTGFRLRVKFLVTGNEADVEFDSPAEDRPAPTAERKAKRRKHSASSRAEPAPPCLPAPGPGATEEKVPPGSCDPEAPPVKENTPDSGAVEPASACESNPERVEKRPVPLEPSEATRPPSAVALQEAASSPLPPDQEGSATATGPCCVGEPDRCDLPALRHAGWHQGKPVPVDAYPIASEKIQASMPVVLGCVSRSRMLRNRLRGVQYLSTLAGDLLVTLIYEGRRLGAAWQAAAEKMRVATGMDFIAQSKGVERLVGGRDSVSEVLDGPRGAALRYKQIAGNFSNPNGRMAEHTLRWLADCAEEIDAKNIDLLELYCGCGNHTVAMAHGFRRVLAVEINRKLVKAAHHNLQANDAVNAFVIRAPSASFCRSMLQRSQWKLNLKTYRQDSCPAEAELPGADAFALKQDLALSEAERAEQTATFTFGAVIVDPPRAGLDEITASLVSRYPYIAYISCNPVALKRDLERLAPTHCVSRMAVFDHFPYTRHLECGVLLRAREKVDEPVPTVPA